VKLLVATSNAGKLVEIREILAGLGLALLSLEDLRLPAPDETAGTFHGNAEQKAVTCARQSGLWTLADDSGLCVDALDGAPGVHSARYAETDEKRRAKLLTALAGVPEQRRSAHFFCAAVLSAPGGERVVHAEGRVDGSIARAGRGTNGFGYDPLFFPAETPGRTLAELETTEKNRLSHRGRALLALLPALAQVASTGILA
jgi:XTP/dITP diphosphohydrolase